MKHFQHFKTDISNINLPEKFTFPFYYEPTDLAKIAVRELQEYLEDQKDFQHDFGLQDSKNSTAIGKMFGVLVVQNKFDEIVEKGEGLLVGSAKVVSSLNLALGESIR